MWKDDAEGAENTKTPPRLAKAGDWTSPNFTPNSRLAQLGQGGVKIFCVMIIREIGSWWWYWGLRRSSFCLLLGPWLLSPPFWWKFFTCQERMLTGRFQFWILWYRTEPHIMANPVVVLDYICESQIILSNRSWSCSSVVLKFLFIFQGDGHPDTNLHFHSRIAWTAQLLSSFLPQL